VIVFPYFQTSGIRLFIYELKNHPGGISSVINNKIHLWIGLFFIYRLPSIVLSAPKLNLAMILRIRREEADTVMQRINSFRVIRK
jgi:hypothetical protein